MLSNATSIDSKVYRDVFSTSAMREVWSDTARVQRYLDVERALSVTQAKLGIIPTEAAEEIGNHCQAAQMDWDRMKLQREHIGSPVLPVVEQLTALCKDGFGQWCHWGATTQDITDTATVLQIRAGLELVRLDLEEIVSALQKLAKKYRDTPMVGRSNLQQAVPLTFGFKAAVWLAGFLRQQERLKQLRDSNQFSFGDGGRCSPRWFQEPMPAQRKRARTSSRKDSPRQLNHCTS